MFYCVPKELSFRSAVFYDLKELFMPNKQLIRVYVARLNPKSTGEVALRRVNKPRSFQILYLHGK